MTIQARFWFVHARRDGAYVALAVAAYTALSARRQARKCLGPEFVIEEVNSVANAHAWVINLGWTRYRGSVKAWADQQKAKS